MMPAHHPKAPSPGATTIAGTLLSSVAVAALVLMLASWRRDEIQDVRGELDRLEVKIVRKIERVEIDQADMRERLANLEAAVGA